MVEQQVSARGAAAVAFLVMAWLLAAAIHEGLPSIDATTERMWMPRLLDAAVAVIGTSLVWWATRRSQRMSSPLALGVFSLTAMALATVGVIPLAALSAVAATALSVARAFAGVISSPAARLVLGFGVVAAITGWLLPFPVFSPTVAALVFGVIALCAWRSLRAELESWRQEANTELECNRTGFAGWALVLAVLIGSMPAWLPLRNPDDLALRVGLGFEMLEFGRARFDVGTQVWALSPWNSDVLHALMTLLAQGEASGPLSAMWVLITAWLARGIAIRLGATTSAALLAGGLYASLPITGFLAGGLQTEAMTAAVLAALATVLLEHKDNVSPRALLAAAVLAGVLLGIKVSNALLLLPVGFWMAIRWRNGFPQRTLPLACIAGFLAGGASYTYAWLLAGNPVLPVLNGIFQSSWFPPVNFEDSTWQTGLPWTLPWRVLVDSSKYFEGTTGAAGLAPLMVLALMPVAIARPRVRAVALVGLAGFVLVISQAQYLRYAHPALVLMIPALMAGISGGRYTHIALAAAVVVQCVLLPTGSWMFMQGILRERVFDGAQVVVERYAPEKLLAADFKALSGPSDRLLMADPLRGFVALLPGRAVAANWHSPRLEALRVVDWNAAETWERIVREAGVNYVIVPLDHSQPGLAGLLAKYSAGTVSRRGHMQLVALSGGKPYPVRIERGIVDGATILLADIPAGFAWAGSMRIGGACNQPGEPVAVAWSLMMAGAPVVQQWEWQYCAPDKTFVLQRDIKVPVDTADEFKVSVSRSYSDSSLRLEVNSVDFDLLRDLHAETGLVDRLLSDDCDLVVCGERNPRILDRPVHF